MVKSKYFKKPKSDNQQLLNMQYAYLNGDAQALSSMYKKLAEIAYKNINSRSRTDARIAALNATTRQQKAHDAATYIIEQYLKRPDFIIKDSVTGYLYTRINWELFGEHQNKRDQILIYTDVLPEKKANKTKYKFLVRNLKTGVETVYDSAAELYLNPTFKGLLKKRLAESIRTGRPWKNYFFDLLED